MRRPVRARRRDPQDAVQLVEHLHRGRRVVDPGGEGPLRDVDELAHSELGVLLQGAVLAQAEGGPDLVDDGVVRGGPVDDGELLAGVPRVPRAREQLDDDPCLAGRDRRGGSSGCAGPPRDAPRS